MLDKWKDIGKYSIHVFYRGFDYEAEPKYALHVVDNEADDVAVYHFETRKEAMDAFRREVRFIALEELLRIEGRDLYYLGSRTVCVSAMDLFKFLGYKSPINSRTFVRWFRREWLPLLESVDKIVIDGRECEAVSVLLDRGGDTWVERELLGEPCFLGVSDVPPPPWKDVEVRKS